MQVPTHNAARCLGWSEDVSKYVSFKQLVSAYMACQLRPDHFNCETCFAKSVSFKNRVLN